MLFLERERTNISEVEDWTFKDVLLNQLAWYFIEEIPSKLNKVLSGLVNLFWLLLMPISVFISTPIIAMFNLRELRRYINDDHYQDVEFTTYRWK
jgi:hypothetical protein